MLKVALETGVRIKKNRNLKSFEKQGTGSVVESLSKSKPSTPRSVGRKYKRSLKCEQPHDNYTYSGFTQDV